MESHLFEFAFFTFLAMAAVLLPLKRIDQWNIPPQGVIFNRFEAPTNLDASLKDRMLWATILCWVVTVVVFCLLSLTIAALVSSGLDQCLWSIRSSNLILVIAGMCAGTFLLWPMRYFVVAPMVWGKDWRSWVVYEITKIEKAIAVSFPFEVDPLKLIVALCGGMGAICCLASLVFLPDSYAGLTSEGLIMNPTFTVGQTQKDLWQDADAFFIVAQTDIHSSSAAPFHVVYFKTGRQWDDRNFGESPTGDEFDRVTLLISSHSGLKPIHAVSLLDCESRYAGEKEKWGAEKWESSN